MAGLEATYLRITTPSQAWLMTALQQDAMSHGQAVLLLHRPNSSSCGDGSSHACTDLLSHILDPVMKGNRQHCRCRCTCPPPSSPPPPPPPAPPVLPQSRDLSSYRQHLSRASILLAGHHSACSGSARQRLPVESGSDRVTKPSWA